MVRVHYFYDPMCGWCYGATALVNALEQFSDLELVMHPGGMIAQQAIDHSFRQHILDADGHIAASTGATFGESYKQKVRSADDLVLDSYITASAILVAEEMGLAPFKMLKAIQAAHYQDGKNVYQVEVLADIASEFGLDRDEWRQRMNQGNTKLEETIENSHTLMGQHNVRGYPTLFVENGEQWIRLPHTSFYNDIAGWKSHLEAVLASN